MLRLLLASALLLPLAACDSGVDENVDVPSGTYTEFGVRHLRDGEMVFEGLAGVYFQRSFRFGTDGTFEVRKRKARTGVKPGTTEKIKIPASKYPAFKPGKGLKDRVRR